MAITYDANGNPELRVELTPTRNGVPDPDLETIIRYVPIQRVTFEQDWLVLDLGVLGVKRVDLTPVGGLIGMVMIASGWKDTPPLVSDIKPSGEF